LPCMELHTLLFYTEIFQLNQGGFHLTGICHPLQDPRTPHMTEIHCFYNIIELE